MAQIHVIDNKGNKYIAYDGGLHTVSDDKEIEIMKQLLTQNNLRKILYIRRNGTGRDPANQDPVEVLTI